MYMLLNLSEAIVKFLEAQKIAVGDVVLPYFPKAFAIFGHGNALGLGDALERSTKIEILRGQNEQGMALAGVAYAKAANRTQCGVVTTSIGPGATNVVTAAGVAMANRLPLLILSGDTFHSRIPDPVLQQVEHFNSGQITANDAFRAVTRYWDRITHPAQILNSLPQALAVLLDPGQCGPVFLGLPQDVAVEVFDYPEGFFAQTIHHIPAYRPDIAALANAVKAIKSAKRPLIISGGGVRYCGAQKELSEFANRFAIPVVETVAGKSTLISSDLAWSGPIGVTGCNAANELAAHADLVIAIGTRLQDFTTGSWTLFGQTDFQMVSINAASFDAIKHGAIALVCDAKEGINEISAQLGQFKVDSSWTQAGYNAAIKIRQAIKERTAAHYEIPTYAQVVAIVNEISSDEDYVLTAAGGLPGELNINWLSKSINSFDCEYGFSAMGYEVAGGWGAAMQLKERGKGGRVFALTGDGSYMMMNSELYSAVLHGDELTVLLCDNRGFGVIQRLQTNSGSKSFHTMLPEDAPQIDFVAHAKSMGCIASKVDIDKLAQALLDSKKTKGVHVIVIDTDPSVWSDEGAFWQVGVAGNSQNPDIQKAHQELTEGLKKQRW